MGDWRPIDETARGCGLVLLWMTLNSTGEPLGYEIGWFEDGDWMLWRNDNGPSNISTPTHWMPLPARPDQSATNDNARLEEPNG